MEATGSNQAFTVGRASAYDAYLLEDPNAKKLGRRPDYPGGWVWRTEHDAAAFLLSPQSREAFSEGPADFAVYELRLPMGWNVDVDPNPDPGDGVHNLINDSLILCRRTW